MPVNNPQPRVADSDGRAGFRAEGTGAVVATRVERWTPPQKIDGFEENDLAGIPRKVAKEYVKASHGQNVKRLPKRKGKG